MPITACWKHFSHEADVGVCGVGATLAEAFEHAALALTAVVTDLTVVSPKEMIRLSCAAPDAELLLVDWLNVLIYEMATRKMLFSRFEVHLEEGHLTAQAWGEALNVVRHHPARSERRDLYCAEGCPTAGWRLARPVRGGRVAF
jgi:SHS2 domain-containing protein